MKLISISKKQIVAAFLIVTMIFTSTSLECFATEQQEIVTNIEENITENKEKQEYEINKEDIIESELTVNSTTYDAGNGVHVTEYYSQNVRFENEDGNLIDYDPSLKQIEDKKSEAGTSLVGYKYENKEGDKKHYFPNELTEETPLLMEYEKYQIRFAPEDTTSVPSDFVEGEKEVVTDVYENEKNLLTKAVYAIDDETISYEYTSTDIGIKEEIVLSEKPETNIFTSVIEIPGLTMRKNLMNEGLTIYDGDDIVAGISAPNMNDASGKAYSEALQYSIEVIDKENGKYRLILTVDEDYLNDSGRKYPVTIDPTLTWYSNAKVSDVYVLSKSPYDDYNFYDSSITAFCVGTVPNGASRTFIKFGNLSAISGRYVSSAKLTFTECAASADNQTIKAYRVWESWTKSDLTWNNKPPCGTESIASFTSTGTTKKKVSLNLTNLMRNYAKGTWNNYGIVLKNTTGEGKYAKFVGARNSVSSYRPKLTVVHYDPPTIPASVSVSPKYVRGGKNVNVKWTDINSKGLSYVQYKIAGYNTSTGKQTGNIVSFSADTKIGTTSDGSAQVTTKSNWEDGAYRMVVRGVDKSGITGAGRGYTFYVDNTKPTGTIKVLSSGTGKETSILQDTVQIIGTVDGTGSPVKKSSMKLYDSEGNFIKDIYTNSTLSKQQCEFTPELENGNYTLKLSVTDYVGLTNVISKNVTIINKLAAPIVQSVYAANNIIEIPWEFPYAASEVCGLAYKLVDSTEWTHIEEISGTKGKLQISLPDEEGIFEVMICGIDKAGTLGAAATVECLLDKTEPRIEIEQFDRGVLKGTIQDENLSEWNIAIKKEGDEEETQIVSGTDSIEHDTIGIIDMQELETDVPYQLKITAKDISGNQSYIVQSITKSESDVLVEQEMPSFSVKRPEYGNNTENHIIFPENVTKMELSAEEEGMIPSGTIQWYCDNELVCVDESWEIDISKSEDIKHSILTVIKDNEGNYHYSRRKINNQDISDVVDGNIIQLPEGCVSIRLNAGDEEKSVQLAIDGESVGRIDSGHTYYITELTDGKKAVAETVVVMTEDNTERWTLESDAIEPETFEFSELENYYPKELSVADKLNYKTYLKWNGMDGERPENIYYEVYRGLQSGFTPSSKNLVASDVQANYWAEMNVNYSKTFYYRVRAVKKDTDGNVVKAGAFSYEIASTVIDADEYIKRMGVKEYWEYAEFETPSGDGYVEKSRGNLVYVQADAAVPNEQLPVTLERTYNSQSSAKTAFGVGWTHSFDMELLNICENDSVDFANIVLKDGNGTLYFYTQNDDGSYVSSMGKYTQLKKEDKSEEISLPEKTKGVSDKKTKVKVDSSFTMKTKDNIEYRFNSSGQMVYMVEANGNFLLFEYEPNKGLLSKVTTSKNISIEFVYHTDEDYVEGKERPDLLTVKEILLPDGSKMVYEYENKRLTGVTQIGTDKVSAIHWDMVYENGIMTKVTDALGNPYTFKYENKKTQMVTYPNGEAIKLLYDTINNQTQTYKVINEGGDIAEILLEINTFEASSGNSLNMIDSQGNSVDYEYENNLLKKTSYSMTYQELSEGKIKEVEVNREELENEADNTEEIYQYDSRENLTEETDEDGVTTTYEYNNKEEKLKDLPTRRVEKDKEGNLISDESYEYDKYGNVTKTYDVIGDITTITKYFAEDNSKKGTLKGEIASETEYVGSETHNKTTAAYTYSYDDEGNKTEVCTEISDEYKVVTTTVYDVMGREISSVVNYDDKETPDLSTVTEYDPFGRIIKVIITQGEITDIVAKQYNDNGALVREKEEDNTIYAYSYDNMNRVVEERIQNGDINKTWTTEYKNGSVEVYTPKGKQIVEHVLITEEKNPDGEILAVTYTDILGNVIREKEDGLYTDYAYDREENMTFSFSLGTEPDSSVPLVTAYLYDVYGNNTHQILNPEYDSELNEYVVTDKSITQSMVYDSTGDVLSVTDGEGNVTSYEYDETGRVTRVVQPIDSSETAGETRVRYDVQNEDGTTSDIITDALGRTSVTTYNATMQPIEIVDVGDGTINAIKSGYHYNSKGLLERQTDSLGTTQVYEYDGKDRVTVIHYLDKNGDEQLRTSYAYDKADNVTEMKDYKVSDGKASLYRYTGFVYDRLKRLIELVEMSTTVEPSSTELATRTIKYEYDIDGNLTGVTYPLKNEWNVKGLKYVYNTDKWLVEIKVVLEDGSTTTLREYSYNVYGDVSEIKDYRIMSEEGTVVNDPEYTVCSYSYDIYLRPISMTYVDSDSPERVMESYTYEYDRNSRIVKETLFNNYPTETSEKQNEERFYSYDTDGKLLSMKVDNLLNATESYIVSYTYDRVGNRISQEKEMQTTAETTEYTYNSLNQLASSVTMNEEGSVTEQKNYLYDANGSQIKETDAITNTIIESSYDVAGRLSSYKKSKNGETVLEQINQYNGAGARIQKKEGSQITNYFYSQGSVLYTENGTGSGTSLNLSGISGNVIATSRPDNEAYFYYHKDIAESTTNLRDSSGTTIVSYQYTDFGETSILGNEDFYNEICYNGAIYDKSTGLYYLSARYYDPSEGRFISRDSYRGDLTNPSTLHLYTYCANNPVNYEDPSGHIAISRIIGGIIGGGAGAYIGSRIAKKTKATGWKKVAIIAGCTIGGAVVGAIAGPKVAKVAKKAAKYVKRKVTSKARVMKSSKKTVRKPKKSTYKKTTKTKKVVSNKKVKKTKTINSKNQVNSKKKTLAQNRKKGRGFEKKEVAKFKKKYNKAEEQITIKTPSGTKTRVDAIGVDEKGNIIINEFKSSKTAPLTSNQKKAFPEIFEKGGVVVGKGKGIFKGGFEIPKGTVTYVIRPGM